MEKIKLEDVRDEREYLVESSYGWLVMIYRNGRFEQTNCPFLSAGVVPGARALQIFQLPPNFV